MHFAPSKYKILLHNWTAWKPNLILDGGELGKVDRFSYLNSCVSPGGRISDGLFLNIQKTRLASMTSACYPVVDQRLGIISNTKVCPFMYLGSRTAEDRGAKTSTFYFFY